MLPSYHPYSGSMSPGDPPTASSSSSSSVERVARAPWQDERASSREEGVAQVRG